MKVLVSRVVLLICAHGYYCDEEKAYKAHRHCHDYNNKRAAGIARLPYRVPRYTREGDCKTVLYLGPFTANTELPSGFSMTVWTFCGWRHASYSGSKANVEAETEAETESMTSLNGFQYFMIWCKIVR